MTPDLRYTGRAEKYARSRWDYAPGAVQRVLGAAAIGPASVVADIGSGTGILTKHFVGRAGRVYAVEPDPEMRGMAERTLGETPSFVSVAATAEATTLPSGSVDLVTVAQAIHWFEPDAARREMARVLKPGGWLAILWNRPAHEALMAAVASLHTEEHGWAPSHRGDRPVEPASYFGEGTLARESFPATWHDTWEHFSDALASDSHAPDEGTPAYDRLMAAARKVFDAFQENGTAVVPYTTELCLGRPKAAS